MSIRISDDKVVFVYDSVTGLAFRMECFEDDNEAAEFVEWAVETAEHDARYEMEALREIWNEYLREEWDRVFYEPVFRGPDCPLCGTALGNETQVHKACADLETMRADLSPV